MLGGVLKALSGRDIVALRCKWVVGDCRSADPVINIILYLNNTALLAGKKIIISNLL